MGCYTGYAFEVLDESGEELYQIPEEIENETIEYFNQPLVQLLVVGANGKWSDHDKDMMEVSKKHPDYVFTLYGSGEGDSDIWKSFYKNGRMYTWRPEISYPPFDEEQLK